MCSLCLEPTMIHFKIWMLVWRKRKWVFVSNIYNCWYLLRLPGSETNPVKHQQSDLDIGLGELQKTRYRLGTVSWRYNETVLHFAIKLQDKKCLHLQIFHCDALFPWFCITPIPHPNHFPIENIDLLVLITAQFCNCGSKSLQRITH